LNPHACATCDWTTAFATAGELEQHITDDHDGKRTYTFFGHWEDGKIVVTDVTDGVVMDDRHDDGRYEEGLWSASGTGRTETEAEAETISEYEAAAA
jgi:hypothetical protein